MAKINGVDTYRPGFFGRLFLWVGGITTAAGGGAVGTALIMNQNAIDREAQMQTKMKGMINGSESRLQAMLELQNKKLEEDFHQQLTDSRTESDDLRGRQNETEKTNADLTRQIENANIAIEKQEQILKKQVSFNEIKNIAKKIAPSAVNVFIGPEEEADASFSGSIIKDLNGKRYFLSCGHGRKDIAEHLGIGDLNEEKVLTLVGYKGLFNVKLKVEALPGGVIGFAPDEKGDLMIIPIPSDINAIFDKIEIEKKVTIGLNLGDMTKEQEEGDLFVGMGNPLNVKDSLYIGFATTPGQALIGSVLQPSFTFGELTIVDPGFNKGNSGMLLVNVEGDVVGIAIAITPSRVVRGTVNGLKHMKPWIEDLGIPVMFPHEKAMAQNERILSSFILSTPQNPFANVTGHLVSKTPPVLLRDENIRPLIDFMLPPVIGGSPLSVLPTQWYSLPKKN